MTHTHGWTDFVTLYWIQQLINWWCHYLRPDGFIVWVTASRYIQAYFDNTVQQIIYHKELIEIDSHFDGSW